MSPLCAQAPNSLAARAPDPSRAAAAAASGARADASSAPIDILKNRFILT